jgi:hypothetical protein
MRNLERRLIQNKMVSSDFEKDGSKPYEIEGLNAIEFVNHDHFSVESDSIDSSIRFSEEDDMDQDVTPHHQYKF